MKKIAKDVYQISLMPRNAINCYWVEGFLIDAGIRSSSKKILKAIDGVETHTHVLTHAHADHQGSSKVICEKLNIPLWCSAAEKDQAESGNPTKEYPKQKHIVTKFQKKYWAGPPVKVDKIIQEGDRIGNFEVIATPGHSSGHLSFFRPSDGVLIVGDVMTNMNLLTTIVGLKRPPGIFTKNRQKNDASILKLAKLQPKTLCFGHGPVLQNNVKFDAFIQRINNTKS